MMGRRRFPVLAAAVALAAACSDTTAPHPTSVSISPRVASLALGDSVQLLAAALGSGGDTLRGVEVVWSSSDTTVLSLSSAGLAKAMAPGRATVAAVVADARDTLSIAVTVRFVQVAGGGVLCAIASNGAAFCRGDNEYGQLGNGSTVSSDTFVPVAGGHRFTSVQVGSYATCGLAADSTAWCWGTGALGTGDTKSRTAPAAVAGGHRFVSLALGRQHACGLTAEGATYCWGGGPSVPTGDSSGVGQNSTSPALVAGAPPFVSLSAGRAATCGITAAHAAWCWGDNTWGQLGVASDTVFHEPVAALGGQRFLTLALRDQYCGLATDGSVHCWASGGYWYRQEPSDGRQYLDLATAWEHACGVASDSTVYCWGYGSDPRAVTHGAAFRSVATGDYADCAVSSGGVAYCWFPHCGYAEDVVCGEAPVQFPVPAARPVTAVSAGRNSNACALQDDGAAVCFYLDFVLYPARADSSTTPVPVPGGLTFRSVVVGSSYLYPLVPYGEYACGLAADSTAWCWATRDNGWGHVPRVTVSTPVAVPGGLQYASLDTYGNHVCGVAVDGAAYCWKPGDAAPSLVPGGRTFTRVFSSWLADCALDAAGQAYCWGRNTNGELGLGFWSSQVSTPVAVGGGHAFDAVAGGSYHTCGLTSGGAAWCWGDNYNSALGTGDTTSSIAPRAVSGGLTFASIVAAGSTGSTRTCALVADGSAYCWGAGVTAPALQQPGTSFISLAPATPSGICGVTTAGAITCWGTPGAAAPRRAPLSPPVPSRSRPGAPTRR